jgi:hypothetical protein
MRASWSALLLAVLAASTNARANAQGSPTAILDRVQVNGRRPIDFHAIALPESVFVGQQATYQVAVLLSPEARSRLRRNPEFLPPELRGLLAYELGTPVRVPARSYGGSVFEAHVFQRALFPVAAGRQVVPAPQLTYAMPQSSSYFSREERFVVNAESAEFVVKPLPIAGRPEDFDGAVGVFKASVRIDTAAARVGDPLVLTLRIQGTGNVKLLPRPKIEIAWASTVPGSERITVDSSGTLVRGAKEFDWILTPAREGRVFLPALRYSYFDPYTARYAVAESSPFDLTVSRGTLAASEEGESAELLPLRAATAGAATIVYWNGRGRPPASWSVWILLALLAPLPALWWARGARDGAKRSAKVAARRTTQDTERAAQAPRTPRDEERYAARTIRRDLLTALSARFEQAPQSLVSRAYVARVLRRAGVTRDTTRSTIALLEELDQLGFAAGESDSGNGASSSATSAARASADLLKRIDAEAMPRGRRIGRSSTVMLLLAFAVGGISFGARPLQARQLITTAPASAARAAYQRRAFSDAEERFAALVKQDPRNPDLLTNWGTAAWAANDTVNAVIAWQRAARLQPLAADLQERMALLPAGARGGVADVPMTPVVSLAQGAIVCWLVGWTLLAWTALRSRRDRIDAAKSSRGASLLRVMGIVAVCVGVVAAGTAWWACAPSTRPRLPWSSALRRCVLLPAPTPTRWGACQPVMSWRWWRRATHGSAWCTPTGDAGGSLPRASWRCRTRCRAGCRRTSLRHVANRHPAECRSRPDRRRRGG